jgi:Flp pilus assembly protein protease CpaA
MKDLLFLLISYEWIFLVMTTKFCIIFCWFEKHDLLVFNVCGFISFEVGYPLFCFTCMGSYNLAFLNFQFSKRVSGISNTLGLGIKFITSKLILIILG